MLDFFTLLKCQGYPVKDALNKLNELKRLNNLQVWQKEQAWRMVHYHYLNNSGYARFVKDIPEEWSSLPVLDKDVMRKFAMNDQAKLKNDQKFYFASTSGSTGKPFRFAKDLFSHALTWIYIADCYEQTGVKLTDLQARFYGIPSTFVAGGVERFKDYLAHRWRFPLLDLSDKALEKWIKIFSRKRFVYLYGYSYPIIIFAKFLEKSNRILKDIVPSLKCCILTAEMCGVGERDLVERAFGVPVCNEYGASEFGILGFAKEEYWELPQELLLTEILDDNGNSLPYGELGNITVTSLFSKGTPFIRYQTGDLGVMNEFNNRQVLTQLFGRREGMAVLPSGKQTPGDTVFYYIIRDFTSKYNLLTEYKVIQKAKDLFEIRYTAPRDLEKNEEEFLKRLCHDSLEKGIEFRFLRLEELDRTRMGKFKRFVSELE